MTPAPDADTFHRAPTGRVLLRALCERCPACGLGHIFVRGLHHERRCDVCGWWFERGPGHWVGGAEINMFVTYWTAALTFVGAGSVFGFSWVTLVLAGVFVVFFSLLIHKKSRSLFFALDYLIDPHESASDGLGFDDGSDGGIDSGPVPDAPRPCVARPGGGIG